MNVTIAIGSTTVATIAVQPVSVTAVVGVQGPGGAVTTEMIGIRDEIEALKVLAAASESAASDSALASAGSASESSVSASESLVSEQASGISAQLAATSEINALGSKNAAATSATTATNQAGVSTTKAGEASTSATNAATSETNALVSKNAAVTSATNAASSATTATTQATTATTKAGEAYDSATTATTKAGEAVTSATTATAQAVIATDKAAIATTKAGEADTSAIAAAASADEAATLVLQALDGAVVGPASAVSDDIAVFDGVSGKFVKDSGVKLSGLATSAHNHNLNNLTEKSYNSLTDKPTIPSVTGLLDETSHDLLDHAGLPGIPTQYTDAMAQAAAPAETVTTIKAALGITALSGTNTGDQDLSGKQDVLVSGDNIKTINGESILGSGDIPIAAGTGVTISGTLSIYVTQQTTLTITNFDSATTYSVSATAGTVTITGDTITYTAGSTAGSVTLTITAGAATRDMVVTVNAAGISAPTNVSPATGATGQLDSVVLSASAFAWIGISTTHLNSDWQVATDSGFTAIVASSSADATNKTSWTVTGLSVNTTYYWRVRYRGATTAVSAYSEAFSFQTAATFNSYIATPAATPAAFGDAFEGGFYTGMIWNELVESATSFLIGTGSKAFTVPDMASTPIVYSGQSLEIRSRANPANKMIGVVTGALGTTLTINVTSVGGSGTFTDWSIMAKYRVIVAPKSSGESGTKTYKVDNTAAPTACQTLSEGRKATLAMVAAGDATMYPAAWFCKNLNIGAKTDWYLPARDELELCWRNLKPTADSNYVTADRPNSAISYTNLGSLDDTVITHGTNNNSSPTGAAYIAGTPAQVAAGKNFRTGESEAFAYGSCVYWSASEYSATGAWRQYWYSSAPSVQNDGNKVYGYYVRAVRRSII